MGYKIYTLVSGRGRHKSYDGKVYKTKTSAVMALQKYNKERKAGKDSGEVTGSRHIRKEKSERNEFGAFSGFGRFKF